VYTLKLRGQTAFATVLGSLIAIVLILILDVAGFPLIPPKTVTTTVTKTIEGEGIAGLTFPTQMGKVCIPGLSEEYCPPQPKTTTVMVTKTEYKLFTVTDTVVLTDTVTVTEERTKTKLVTVTETIAGRNATITITKTKPITVTTTKVNTVTVTETSTVTSLFTTVVTTTVTMTVTPPPGSTTGETTSSFRFIIELGTQTCPHCIAMKDFFSTNLPGKAYFCDMNLKEACNDAFFLLRNKGYTQGVPTMVLCNPTAREVEAIVVGEIQDLDWWKNLLANGTDVTNGIPVYYKSLTGEPYLYTIANMDRQQYYNDLCDITYQNSYRIG